MVTLKNNARLVYSTATAGKCPVCGWPQRDCQCSTRRAADEPVPDRIVAKLRMEKKGRGGKTVTVVYGLPQNAALLKDLSQELKRACGTGGTVIEDGVELQGDVRPRVRDALSKRGYVVKG
jgi:translation initiation factor 1